VPDWVWRLRFGSFEKKGDILMLVSPGGIQIYLTNAEAIHQIRQVTAKREAFRKPLESFRVLDIFGRNVITTEGGEWKQHRKYCPQASTRRIMRWFLKKHVGKHKEC